MELGQACALPQLDIFNNHNHFADRRLLLENPNLKILLQLF